MHPGSVARRYAQFCGLNMEVAVDTDFGFGLSRHQFIQQQQPPQQHGQQTPSQETQGQSLPHQSDPRVSNLNRIDHLMHHMFCLLKITLPRILSEFAAH